MTEEKFTKLAEEDLDLVAGGANHKDCSMSKNEKDDMIQAIAKLHARKDDMLNACEKIAEAQKRIDEMPRFNNGPRIIKDKD